MGKKRTTKEFIERAREIHGDKYDYSKVEYIRDNEKVCIICPKHGEFWQTPSNHLHKVKPQNCPKCSHRSYKYTNEEFIKLAQKVHGIKYDYSKVIYKNNKTPITIICPIHGEFSQIPTDHIISKAGCPHCNESKLEKYIAAILTKNNIRFERQKRFKWLGKQSLDFFLVDYNIGIECQGEQHYVNSYFSQKHRRDANLE